MAPFDDAERRTAEAMERLVGSRSFGELLAMSAENVVALMRMGSDAMDLVWRNLRVAGRQDVTRLARQLQRTEDKLERVLVELEELRAQRDEPKNGRVGAKDKARSTT